MRSQEPLRDHPRGLPGEKKPRRTAPACPTRTSACVYPRFLIPPPNWPRPGEKMPGWARHDAALAHPGAGGGRSPLGAPPGTQLGPAAPQHLTTAPPIPLGFVAPLWADLPYFEGTHFPRRPCLSQRWPPPGPIFLPLTKRHMAAFFFIFPSFCREGITTASCTPPELISPSPKPQIICFARASPTSAKVWRRKRDGASVSSGQGREWH